MAIKTEKTRVITFRLTDVQYAPLEEPIAHSGLKPNSYIRQVILSRSPTVEVSSLDKKRMRTAFEKAGLALNHVAHAANAAPYKERLYLSKYLHWFNKLSSIYQLLGAVVPNADGPMNLRKASTGNKGSPAKSEKNTHMVSFRLSVDELAQFEPVIRLTGSSLSNFFRELLVNPIPIFKEFTGLRKRLIFIVNKAGNNITQLAYVAETAFQRGLIDENFQLKWLDMLVSIEELLLAGVEHAD
jgi:hypothetical protein